MGVNTAISEEALHGSLTDFPLAALMRSLESRRRTGALSLAGGGEIWFTDGRVYLATNPDGSPLSAVLFGADVGTLDEIERLFAEPDESESVLDRILTQWPDREPLIRRLLHEYNLNTLFALLVPSDAQFGFESGRSHRLGERLAADTGTLLAQAEHRIEIWRMIATRIPSTTATFRLAMTMPDQRYERMISADEWRYLARLDGHTSVAEVITSTGESAFRVCSTLYRFLLEGLIEES
jgi:hypothetical protein